MDQRSNGSVENGSAAGFIKAAHREPKEVWEIGIVEPAPFGRKAPSDFTNIGTAFKTGEGEIELTLKPGISVSGRVVLRRR